MHLNLNKKIMVSAAASVIMTLTLQACSGDTPASSSADSAAPAVIGDVNAQRAAFIAPYTSDPFSTLQRFGQPKLTASAQEYWDNFTPDMDPAIQCLPSNLPRELFGPSGMLVSFEANGDVTLSLEHVHMNGAQFPAEYAMENRAKWPTSRFGYSIGYWDGNVLKVETRGVLERDVLIGHVPILPSPLMILTREFKLIPVDQRWEARGLAPQEVNPYMVPGDDAKTLEMKTTYDDPKNLQEPWSVVKHYREVSDTQYVTSGSDEAIVSTGGAAWEGTAAAANSGVPEEFLANYDGGCVLFPEYDETGVGDINYVPE